MRKETRDRLQPPWPCYEPMLLVGLSVREVVVVVVQSSCDFKYRSTITFSGNLGLLGPFALKEFPLNIGSNTQRTLPPRTGKDFHNVVVPSCDAFPSNIVATSTTAPFVQCVGNGSVWQAPPVNLSVGRTPYPRPCCETISSSILPFTFVAATSTPPSIFRTARLCMITGIATNTTSSVFDESRALQMPI